jgi:hypothetical protein
MVQCDAGLTQQTVRFERRSRFTLDHLRRALAYSAAFA